METDKYKLAFQKIFDKKKLKDKYRGNPQDAAKKALEKVKRMKGAADFNMFINNYKGEVKGIKVFLKKNKKQKDEKEKDALIPPPEKAQGEKPKEENNNNDDDDTDDEYETDALLNYLLESTNTKRYEQKKRKDIDRMNKIYLGLALAKIMRESDKKKKQNNTIELEKKEKEEEEEESSVTEEDYDKFRYQLEQRLKKGKITKREYNRRMGDEFAEWLKDAQNPDQEDIEKEWADYLDKNIRDRIYKEYRKLYHSESEEMEAPKISKTPKPTMEETEPIHGTQGPTPMMTPKQSFPAEPLEAPPAPKASSKAAPSFSTPTATPKIKNVKQVAPKPPRKIPQGLTQKYETSTVTFDLSATSPASPTAKRIKDYRNNPEDRRAAYTKMCRCI